MNDKLREILERYFGQEYLKDMHTGEIIDMSIEIDQAHQEIINLLLSEEELTTLLGGLFKKWNLPTSVQVGRFDESIAEAIYNKQREKIK